MSDRELPSPSAMTLAVYIKEHLLAVADEGTGIDTGLGLGVSDLWVTIEGKTYLITVKDAK